LNRAVNLLIALTVAFAITMIVSSGLARVSGLEAGRTFTRRRASTGRQLGRHPPLVAGFFTEKL
jgi:hypothetical protein